MNLAKKKPATWGSDGRHQKGNLEHESSTINSAPRSNLSTDGMLRADRHGLGHGNLVKETYGYYHRDQEKVNRKWRLFNLMKLITDRHGSHNVPESDDTAYFEVAARAIDDFQFFAEWCSRWAPWASNKLVMDIFNSREISERDMHPDQASKLLNVSKDEYERLKLHNIGYTGKTQLERQEEAKERKRKNDIDAKERKRRENGVQTREEWLKSVKSKKPWVKYRLERWKYYALKKDGKLPELGSSPDL